MVEFIFRKKIIYYVIIYKNRKFIEFIFIILFLYFSCRKLLMFLFALAFHILNSFYVYKEKIIAQNHIKNCIYTQ